MDKLRAIRVFAAIAEHGSLTEAATHLGTSLPTVVRTLAALEEDVGVRLFNRSTRRIALTEEGEIYLRHCQTLLGELASTEAGLRGDGEAPRGLVHVTAPLTFGAMHVTPAINHLLTDYPDLRIRLVAADRLVDLVEEHIDIAARIGHLNDSSLMQRQVGHMRQVLCASSAFLASHGRPTIPEDVSDLPCLQVNGNNAGLVWPFRRNKELLNVPVQGRFISNIMQPVVDACLSGIGLGLFLEYQVADHIRAGRLELLLPDFEPPALPVQLVYPHSKLLSPRVRTVLDGLARHLSRSLQTAALASPE